MTEQENVTGNNLNLSNLMADIEKMPLPDKLKNWNQVIEFKIANYEKPYQIIVENGQIQIAQDSTRKPNIVYSGNEAEVINYFVGAGNVALTTSDDRTTIGDTVKWGIFRVKAVAFLQKKPDLISVEQSTASTTKWLMYAVPALLGFLLIQWLIGVDTSVILISGIVAFLIALIIKVALEIVKNKLFK